MQDRGNHELDHDHQARQQSGQCPQPVEAAGGEQQHDEAEGEPQHRAASIEVRERVVVALPCGTGTGGDGVLVHANPVALRDVE